MSRTEMTSPQKAIALLFTMVGLTLIIGVGLLLRAQVPGNMGTGFLVGAGVAIIAILIMGWRVSRASSGATTFERAFTSHGDERDDTVLTKALSVLGLLSLPLTGAAGIAIGLGAEVMMVVFILMATQVLSGAIAFAVTARRH